MLLKCKHKTDDDNGPAPVNPVGPNGQPITQTVPVDTDINKPGFFTSYQPVIAEKGLNSFSSDELQSLKEVQMRSRNFNIDAPNDGIFKKFFGSFAGANDREKLGTYMSTRIKYMVRQPGDNSGNSSTIAENKSANEFAWFPALINKFIDDGIEKSDKMNLSTFKINDTVVSITSPGFGYIGFTGMFFAKTRTDLDRIATLMHEARHSDCNQIPNPAQAKAFLVSRDNTGWEKCTFGHAKCPVGHDLEGSYACDNLPWGSYAVTLIIQNAIVNYCNACTDAEKTASIAREKDARSRILILDKILSGEAGLPDLTRKDLTN